MQSQLLTLKTSLPPLSRYTSTPSPSSSHSSSSASSFDSPHIDNLTIRRNSEPVVDTDRRESTGSMTSWGSAEDGASVPPDKSGVQQIHPTDSLSTFSSQFPYKIGTPEGDHIEQFQQFFFPKGNSSPASSVTSTAPSKGEATPRAEIPQPSWPLSALTPTKARETSGDEPESMDIDQTSNPTNILQQPALRNEANWRRRHGSLEMPQPPNIAATLAAPPAIGQYQTDHQAVQSVASPQVPRHSSTGSLNSYRPSTGDSARTSISHQRVVAESTATGCCISAPLSPPAHYPGSSRPSSQRTSGSQTAGETSSVSSSSSSSIKSSSSSSFKGLASAASAAPRWAHPPKLTNRISGRAWSFSQGQERPDVDFDPELFEGVEPDSIEEVMKGMDGRIAVKTTPTEYNIMAWLPGFSIDDITISMKGDRTVQIVADLWDEEDHAQWNVVLGEDVNKSAIGATFKGAELRVTVMRKQPVKARSVRSNFSSWSAPAKASTPRVASRSAPDHPTAPAPPVNGRVP